MPREEIEARVRAIMSNYRVNQKFVRGPGRRNYAYAVYAGPNRGRVSPSSEVKQISSGMSSPDAKKLMNDLIVADIVSFIESIKEQ